MIDYLRLFLRIVDRGGLAAAGREFNLSPATVSERLAALEKHYGCALINRTTRSISLSEEGRLLAETARRIVHEADEIELRIKHGFTAISGPIRLTAPLDLGRNTLLPLLDTFLEAHPGVTLDLELTDGYLDVVGGAFDLAIRFGNLEDSSLRLRNIGPNRRIACASPEYLTRHGVPQCPADLQHHECLIMRFGANADREWAFLVNGRQEKVRVSGRRTANSGELVRAWCKAGYGIARKSEWDIREDLRSGALVEILKDFAITNSNLQLLLPPGREAPQRVRMLADHIVAGMRALLP